MRETWMNIAHTSGAKIYSMLIGVLTLSLTARLLGPEGRGEVAVISTWISLFSTFAYLSLGQVALNRMADDLTKQRFGHLLGSLIFLTIVLTFVGWLVALWSYLFDPEGWFKGLPGLPLLIGFLSLPFMIWEQYGSSLLIGLERIRIYNKYQIMGRTFSALAIVMLVGGMGWGVSGVVGANLVGQMIVASGGLAFLVQFVRRQGLLCRPDKIETKALLTGGVKLHLNAIGSFFVTSINVLILNSYYGAEETAYFQLALQLLSVLVIIPQAASMVIYGKVSRLGPNGAWPENKRLLIHITIAMTVLGIFAAILAPWGITLLAGEKFFPAVKPFQWMLVGLIGMSFSTVMAPQWIGRGYLWQAAGLTFLVGAINLAANFWLIPLYGITGAVYAFLGTYSFSVIANGAMVRHCQIQHNKDM